MDTVSGMYAEIPGWVLKMKPTMWLMAVLLSLCSTAFGIDKDSLVDLLETARVEMKMPGLRAAVRFKDGRMKFDPSSEWTGGGLVTNPTMLVQFYGALVEGRVVKPESLDQMVDAGWRNPETPGSHCGFGLFVYDNGKSFGHSGLWPGYLTEVTYYETTGMTIAVQTNRDGRVDLESLSRRIAALVP